MFSKLSPDPVFLEQKIDLTAPDRGFPIAEKIFKIWVTENKLSPEELKEKKKILFSDNFLYSLGMNFIFSEEIRRNEEKYQDEGKHAEKLLDIGKCSLELLQLLASNDAILAFNQNIQRPGPARNPNLRTISPVLTIDDVSIFLEELSAIDGKHSPSVSALNCVRALMTNAGLGLYCFNPKIFTDILYSKSDPNAPTYLTKEGKAKAIINEIIEYDKALYYQRWLLLNNSQEKSQGADLKINVTPSTPNKTIHVATDATSPQSTPQSSTASFFQSPTAVTTPSPANSPAQEESTSQITPKPTGGSSNKN